MLLRSDCFRQMDRVRDGQSVICGLGGTSHDWYAVTGDENAFYMKSSMGMVSSFALGLALALPEHRIWGIEGDGALAMNLGSLLTLGAEQPPNLVHFVMCNRTYGSTGGQPLVNGQRVDFEAVARGAGVNHAYTFREMADFRQSIDEIVNGGVYSLVVLEIDEPAQTSPAVDQGTVMSQPLEMAYQFIRHLERSSGAKVLT